jgi:hypothetical protein
VYPETDEMFHLHSSVCKLLLGAAHPLVEEIKSASGIKTSVLFPERSAPSPKSWFGSWWSWAFGEPRTVATYKCAAIFRIRVRDNESTEAEAKKKSIYKDVYLEDLVREYPHLIHWDD